MFASRRNRLRLSQHFSAWVRIPLTMVVALLMPGVGVAQEYWTSDRLPPPSGWSDWTTAGQWHSMSVRGQDGLAFVPQQPSDFETRDAGFVSPFERRARELEAAAAPAPQQPSPQKEAQEKYETAEKTTPSGGEIDARDFANNPDQEIASVVQKSNRVKTTEFQKRSQVSSDPNIRGYQGPAVYALSDGAYWSPIRPDLDSMLNRLDPSLYESVSVISGPYGLRYGPGFSFLRVLNVDTPRYPNSCGCETDFRTGISTRTNGGQLYGRQTALGGGSDWGYIFNYSHRVGGDYEAGGAAGLPPVPGSYKSRSLLGQIGFDLSPQSSIEFRFRRLDDTDIQYPLQFFDVDYLGADAYSIHYDREDSYGSGTFSAVGWYSLSRFHGDTFPKQPESPYYTVERVNAALEQALQTDPLDGDGATPDLQGDGFGHKMITGARVNKTYGEPDWTLLSFGADFRYMTNRIGEHFVDAAGILSDDITTNLPKSELADSGLYAELTLSWLSYLSTTLGGRLDWVHTSTDQDELRERSNLHSYREQLDQNDVLYALYLSNELELNRYWTVRLAGGHSQRPPSMLERYADGVFVSTAQNGLTRVIGTPTLKKEELWQIDLSLEGGYERWGGKVGAFYSWVDDPITHIGFPVKDPTGAYLVRYTNGNLFLRTGFEMMGDFELTERITAFGTARYLWGEDRNIRVQGGGSSEYRDVPLVGIYPFSSDVGIRIHDANGGSRWGLEFAARMVDTQSRTGSLRRGFTIIQDLDPDFESRTAGFTTFGLRGYFNATENFYVVGGIENLFDRAYRDHLNQRLPADTIGSHEPFPEVAVLAPGISPYFGFELDY